MTDEKREHSAGWAWPVWHPDHETANRDKKYKPIIAFRSVEARDAALRDLEAMAALRSERVEGVHYQTVDDDARAVWWTDEEARPYSDPADAILSAPGEAPSE